MKGMIKVGRWANEHKHAAAAILDKQTFYLDVEDTYRGIKHIDMVPNLSPQNLASVEIGKDFMLSHGYIKNDFDVQKWAAPEFLETGGEGTARRAVEEEDGRQASGGDVAADGLSLRLGPVEPSGRGRAGKAAAAAFPPAPVEQTRNPEMNAEQAPTRMQRIGYRTPIDAPEPDQLVLVDYLSGGRVAVVTLNRPHADNAITTELAASLIEVLETIAARASVRVAIITGAGDRAFSVGGDLRQRKSMTKEEWLRQRQVFDRVLYTLRQLRRPIIAAVHGMAYGGGCEIAISTDFIIASDDAIFGQPEAMVGLSAGGGSPVLLPRLLPRGRALQMLMTGEPITAEEAHRLGMVNELHPRAELMNAVLRIAEQIASNSPTAVQAVKRAVLMGEGEPIEQAVAIMMEAHWRSVVHPDRVEGIRAFNEDREPTFPDPDF